MIRLAFELTANEDLYRAAASRMRGIIVVDRKDGHDAIVSDRNGIKEDGGPVLDVSDTPAASDHHIPAFPRRFDPATAAVRASLDAGELGALGLVRLHLWQASSMSEKQQLDAIDLVRWLFDDVPDSVYHGGRPGHSELIHMGFPNGGMALIDFAQSLPVGSDYHSLCLVGSNGTAYADDHYNRNLIFANQGVNAELQETHYKFIQPMLEDFVESVRRGESGAAARRDLRSARDIRNRATLSSA